MLISIVGKSGSGKSFITKELINMNKEMAYLDIDKIGHQVTEKPKVKEKLLKVFGNIILRDDEINRKELGKIVFNSKEAMEILTKITWQDMEKEIDLFIKDNSQKIIILDWQLLPKTKYFMKSDLKILVTAPLEIRMMRIIKRDNINKEKFLEREQASLDFIKYHFDYIIENINQDKTKEEVEKVYEESIISR